MSLRAFAWWPSMAVTGTPRGSARVSLVTLGVRDLARSRRFYEALGWTTHSKPGDDVVFFQTGGFVVGLWDRSKLAEDSGVEDGGRLGRRHVRP